jgi:hypothetical protein
MGTSRLFVNLLRPGVDGLSLAFSSSLVFSEVPGRVLLAYGEAASVRLGGESQGQGSMRACSCSLIGPLGYTSGLTEDQSCAFGALRGSYLRAPLGWSSKNCSREVCVLWASHL